MVDHPHRPSGAEEELRARDNQIAALTEIVGALARNQRALESRLAQLAATTTRPKASDDGPAPWVWSAPTVTPHDDSGGEQDPLVTADNFVSWYNSTFAGVEGSRSKSIPPCWRHHPGLVVEVAVLTQTWLMANTGPAANARDAQQWLHQWRPGFAERCTRDWAHADCFDGEHRSGGC